MKLQQIQPQTFESKKRSLNSNQLKCVKTLLMRMNAETKLQQGEYFFSSTITKELNYKKSRFIDGRMLLAKAPINKQMQRETLLSLGKIELVIDNSTGEIIEYHKPFFTSWSTIMRKIDRSLAIFIENFNNKKVVNKKKITIDGYTQKGAEIIDNVKGKV